MKRILSIILVVGFLLVSFSFGSVSAKDTQEPTVTGVVTQILSHSEFMKILAKSKGISLLSAELYDASMKENFQKMHPELFGPASAKSITGYYEPLTYSRYTYCGLSYGGCPIYITQYVPAEVYVDGSFREFVYVLTPYSQPGSGNYTWVPSYNYVELNSPTQFTARGAGYAEVAIQTSQQFTIGLELQGLGFTVSYTSGTTMYYRKSCTLSTWSVSLY